jgi:hypothetical protein
MIELDLISYIGYYDTMKIYGFFDYQINDIINNTTVKI